MHQILGIDAGNSSVKLFDGTNVLKFPSDLGEFRMLKLTNKPLVDDMIYEYKGLKGFAGTLAQRESEFGGSMLGSSKVHSDMLIRVLIALHRASSGEKASFDIIVGQPISNHTDGQKISMKEMLLGEHEFTLNGVTRILSIDRAEVVPEGASAFWCSPRSGKIRIIDAGSGTVNLATLKDGAFVDKESETLPFGFNTNVSSDIDAFARRVAIACSKKWGKRDSVYIVGGKAEQLSKAISYHFPTADVLKPRITIDNTEKLFSPIYANAVAFYNIAKKVYQHDKV